MNYIKKLLNPLNPILPAFLLLIAFLGFEYSSFLKEKYTEEEKTIFEEGIKFTDKLSDLYRRETKQENKDIYNEDYQREFCLKQSYLELYSSNRKLDSLTYYLIRNNYELKIKNYDYNLLTISNL